MRTTSPNGWLICFDLKAVYHHLKLRESQRKYFGFSFEDAEGNTRYFQFDALPFGLSVAGWFFTQVLKHCAYFLNSIHHIVYVSVHF